MYADLIGNYKKQGIKSPCGNNVLGKSFLIAVFACCRAILYPGTIIVIAAKARSQSINLLKKITKILMPMSPNLRTEIKDVMINLIKRDNDIQEENEFPKDFSSEEIRGHEDRNRLLRALGRNEEIRIDTARN